MQIFRPVSGGGDGIDLQEPDESYFFVRGVAITTDATSFQTAVTPNECLISSNFYMLFSPAHVYPLRKQPNGILQIIARIVESQSFVQR